MSLGQMDSLTPDVQYLTTDYSQPAQDEAKKYSGQYGQDGDNSFIGTLLKLGAAAGTGGATAGLGGLITSSMSPGGMGGYMNQLGAGASSLGNGIMGLLGQQQPSAQMPGISGLIQSPSSRPPPPSQPINPSYFNNNENMLQ